MPGPKPLDGEGEPHHTAEHAKIPRIAGNFSACADSVYQATPHELIQIAGEFSGVAAFHSLQLCFYPVPI